MPVTPLSPPALKQRCDPDQLGFETTADLEDLGDVIGQTRAVEAVKFGIGIRREGYNLFAIGPNSIGKYTTVRRFVDDRAAGEPVPDDWCYVNNFQDRHRPHSIKLPPGMANKLKRDMERLVEELQATIPAVFESDEYRTRHQAIDEEFKERQEATLGQLQERARERKVALVRTPMGLALAPMKDGEVVTPDEFRQLPEEERVQVEKDIEGLQHQLQSAMNEMPQWEKARRDQVRDLDRDITMSAVRHLIDALQAEYKPYPQVVTYLDAVRTEVIENAADFRSREEEGQVAGPAGPASPMIRLPHAPPDFRRYQVNVIVSNGDQHGAPVIYEDNPTQPNLVGRVEHLAELGALVTDFSLIKQGAIHRANGGYLILDAYKVLTQPYAWEALKRVLKSREIRIESLGQAAGMISTITLDPEPIPLDVKVVLVGERRLYYLLSTHDPDFDDLFKVEVDFDEDMDRSIESSRQYAGLIATLARREKLRSLDRGAVASIIEHSSRLSGDAEKLSARVGQVCDLLREADYWAGQAERQVIGRGDVKRAIDAQIFRSDRVRQRVQEAIRRNTILIDTSGAKAGQVNGLSVLALGGFSFGQPSRITARVRMGRGEVVDIEREVELGGPLHSKGVLILSAYIGAQYALDRPLSLGASLVFEQSYGGVDGDSASSAELYALLSALAEMPIKQSLAVTGSVNQYGEVQAIGGVNEKIEGFFDVCSARGLTGEHGVLVPDSNVKHLMLRDDVVEAVAEGRFAIYSVKTIAEGIEILTGVPAGERDESGAFPPGSLNEAVDRRLIELAEARRSFGAGAAEGDRQ